MKGAIISSIILLLLCGGTPMFFPMLIALIAVFSWFIYKFFKSKQEMAYGMLSFAKEYNCHYGCSVSLVSGLPLVGEDIELYLSKDKLYMNSTTTDNLFQLPLADIISVQSTTVKELAPNNKSAIGRGVVGGLVGGVGGAVIGSASANKSDTQDVFYIHIFHREKDSSVSNATFSTHSLCTANDFLREVNSLITNNKCVDL